MNRSSFAAAAALLVTSGFGSLGCASHTGMTLDDRYRNVLDPCAQDRYCFAAREAVIAPFSQQVATGHFLNQTIWNWYFEPGTDKLTPAGIQKLDSLAQATPAPDPKVYLQAARDVLVTPENTDQVGTLRNDLTARRKVAVERYLATQPGNTVIYEIAIHDAPPPSISAAFGVTAFRGQASGYKGGITGTAGGSPASSGGSSLPQTTPTTGGTGTPGGGGGTPGGGPNGS